MVEQTNSRGDIAKSYFLEGYNCTQAVVLSFADKFNVDKNILLKMVSGFGGGIGRQREVCGTVSGMVFVISNLYGYDDPKATNEKASLYSDVQEVCNRFKAQNGSIICSELLGINHGAQSPIPEKRTGEYYKKRPCADLCKIAADIVEKYINEKNTCIL